MPTPNYAAENNEDSTIYKGYEVECEKCGRSFDVTIYNAMYGGSVEVEGVDDVNVDEQYAEDAKKVVLQDLDGYIVSERNGQILVCKRSEEQRIREFSAD